MGVLRTLTRATAVSLAVSGLICDAFLGTSVPACALRSSRSASARTVMSTEAAPAAPVPIVRKRAKNREMDLEFLQETPGGWIGLLNVKNFQALSHHRIVCNRDMVESLYKRAGVETVDIERFFKYVIKYMLDKGMKLDNTEGMIDGGVFPVNYFTVGQLSYFHDDVEENLVKIIADAPDL